MHVVGDWNVMLFDPPIVVDSGRVASRRARRKSASSLRWSPAAAIAQSQSSESVGSSPAV